MTKGLVTESSASQLEECYEILSSLPHIMLTTVSIFKKCNLKEEEEYYVNIFNLHYE